MSAVLELKKVDSGFSYYYNRGNHYENLYIKDIGPINKCAGEDWTTVEIYEHTPDKYKNTFNRLGNVRVLVEYLDNLVVDIEKFERPIINY